MNETMEPQKLKDSSDFNNSSPKKIEEPRKNSLQDGEGVRIYPNKDGLICRFCGGKTCKEEDWLLNKNSVIKGLNSGWMTDNILASQRPSTRLIEEFDIVNQFKQNNIYTILNLQEPGEHPHCGDGVHSDSGFSYRPKEFLQDGIFYYNFGWEDMTVTDFNTMFNILDVMNSSLKDGKKIMVHCHAGRGRTILVIASYLIFYEGYTAELAIKLSSLKRDKILTRQSQRDFLFDFEKHINNLRKVFYELPTLTVDDVLKNQSVVLNSDIRQNVKNHPYILYKILKQVSLMMEVSNVTPKEVFYSVFHVDKKDVFTQEWEGSHNQTLKKMKELINLGRYEEITQIKDVRILSQVLLDFFEGLITPVITAETLLEIEMDQNGQLENLQQYIKRSEFIILTEVSSLLKNLVARDSIPKGHINLFGLRIAIALLRKRKTLEKHFFGRNLVDEKIKDTQVCLLSAALINFSQQK